ncbi:MAG: hypothetical protein MZU97_07845 [Bacillus subtilis]|nr:hypothetical protein [Bacillus subtilis]
MFGNVSTTFPIMRLKLSIWRFVTFSVYAFHLESEGGGWEVLLVPDHDVDVLGCLASSTSTARFAPPFTFHREGR